MIERLLQLLLIFAASTAAPVSASPLCPVTSDDEHIVEYFNEITFENKIKIRVTDAGSQYEVRLDCPPQISRTIPGPKFLLALTTPDTGGYTLCDHSYTSVVFTKAELTNHKRGFCGGSKCILILSVSNGDTRYEFSSTQIEVNITPGTTVPKLNPASLPNCSHELSHCLTGSSCETPPSHSAGVILCRNPSACPKESNKRYDYNDGYYLQNIIQSVEPDITTDP